MYSEVRPHYTCPSRQSIMPATPNQQAGQKRKASTNFHNASGGRKRQKAQDARHIPVQSRDVAVSATGELDVASFLKAREFEINALEKSMQKARKGLTQRAFQQVPRAMRRRTASHNVKKVPRRLRRRAEREVSGRSALGVVVLIQIVADESLWDR